MPGQNGMSPLERAVLWISFLLLIVIGVYLLFGSGGDTGDLANRVTAVEAVLDANGDGDLTDYAEWADAMSTWADEITPPVAEIWDFFKEGFVTCDPDCPIEGGVPPGDPPCKPGQC